MNKFQSFLSFNDWPEVCPWTILCSFFSSFFSVLIRSIILSFAHIFPALSTAPSSPTYPYVRRYIHDNMKWEKMRKNAKKCARQNLSLIALPSATNDQQRLSSLYKRLVQQFLSLSTFQFGTIIIVIIVIIVITVFFFFIHLISLI